MRPQRLTQVGVSLGHAPCPFQQVGVQLVQEKGILVLTRGMGLRVLYFAPLVGIFFGVYEFFRSSPTILAIGW